MRFGCPTNGGRHSHSGADAWYTFSGKHFDNDAGLYYYGFRWYDAQAKRWTQPDPSGLAEGLDLYRFCDNDPVNGVDADGLAQNDLYRASCTPLQYEISMLITRIAKSHAGKSGVGLQLVRMLYYMNENGAIRLSIDGKRKTDHSSGVTTIYLPSLGASMALSDIIHEGIHALQPLPDIPNHIAMESEAEYYADVISGNVYQDENYGCLLNLWRHADPLWLMNIELAYRRQEANAVINARNNYNQSYLENNAEPYLRNLFFESAQKPYKGLAPIKGLLPYQPQRLTK